MTAESSNSDPTSALQIGLLMSFMGGFLDAYSYVGWDGVFAGAQSVNIVLTAIAVAQGNWLAATHHLPSILAFCMAVVAADLLKSPALAVRRGPDIVILGLEAMILLSIGLFSPSMPSSLVTASMAFAAGLQLTYFGRLDAWAYNSTMTTGNLRNLLEAATSAALGRDHVEKLHSVALGKAIGFFAVGAGIGGLATHHFHARAICIALPVLFLAIHMLLNASHCFSPVETSR